MLFPWTTTLLIVTPEQTDSPYKAPTTRAEHYQINNPFNVPMQAVLAWHHPLDGLDDLVKFSTIDVYASEGVIKLTVQSKGAPARVRLRVSALFKAA